MGVLVIDSNGSIVGRCLDQQPELVLNLPRGLYTIRTNRCGNFFELPLRLDSAQTINAPGPGIFTAAPIPGATTTHEYYSNPAWETSMQPTALALKWNGPVESGILLFARAPEANQYYGEDQFAGLSLRTLDGLTLSTFQAADTRRESTGASAFSILISPGLLILEDAGEKPRQIPIPLLRGWQTQIFTMHRARLLWEDMRVHLVSADDISERAKPDRNPYDFLSEDLRTAPAMDLGLLALQNDAPSVWPQLITLFLESDAKNPLLGLLGAYLMMLQNSRSLLGSDRGLAPEDERVFEVLDLLHQLIPDSADLAALCLLARDLLPSLPAPIPAQVSELPLFRIGAETLLKEYDLQPESGFLPKGSLLLAIRHRLHRDCVWTTWEPIELPPSEDISKSLAPQVRQLFQDKMEFGQDFGFMPNHDSDSYMIGVIFEGINSLDTLLNKKKKPTFSQSYDLLVEVLADFSSPGAAAISPETALTEYVPSDDRDGLFWLTRRISRRFREFNINLSETEIAAVATVSDLAHLIIRKND